MGEEVAPAFVDKDETTHDDVPRRKRASYNTAFATPALRTVPVSVMGEPAHAFPAVIAAGTRSGRALGLGVPTHNCTVSLVNVFVSIS